MNLKGFGARYCLALSPRNWSWPGCERVQGTDLGYVCAHRSVPKDPPSNASATLNRLTKVLGRVYISFPSFVGSQRTPGLVHLRFTDLCPVQDETVAIIATGSRDFMFGYKRNVSSRSSAVS